jgi:WbqC-like protein family
MKTVAIHQPQYLPYTGFFHKIAHADIFVHLDNVQFQKNGLQNRNKIRTQQGWQWLTVPVSHHFGQLILDVQLDATGTWPLKHWNALATNYSRAPFFKQYAGGLKDLLLENKFDRLCALNVTAAEWVMEQLEIKTPMVLASTLDVSGTQSELLISICRALGADTYLSGPGGKQYMDMSAFENAGIKVIWQDFIPPVYEQVFRDTEFVPNLSIVDVLFNCGPQTTEFYR